MTPTLCSDWQKLFRLLALDAAGAVLPCTSTCPACAGVLTSFQDNICGGTWHHCSDCKFSGDMVELAAVVWQITIEQAFERLTASGLIMSSVGRLILPDYLNGFYRKRRAAQNLWEASDSLLEASRPLRCLLGAHDAGELSWAKFGHNLARLASPQTLKNAGISIGMKLVDQVAILPLRDLPGRIVAFVLAVSARDEAPIVARRECLVEATKTRPAPPAVLAVEAVFNATPGQTIVVADNYLTAARIHIRCATTHYASPALIACRSASTLPADVRQHALRCRVMVWGEEASSNLMALAASLNGRVVIETPKARELSIKTRSAGKIEAWLNSLAQESVPWRDLLRSRLFALPAAAAAVFIEEMKIDREELTRLLGDENTSLAVKLKSGGFSTGRTVTLDGQVVIEDQHGWRLAKTGELVSDAIIRVDRAVTRTGTGRTWYQGRVLYREEEIDYVVDGREFERHALRFARQYLLEKQKGLVCFKESWSQRSFELSLLFQPVTAVETVSGYGWDKAHNRFLLPDYSIELGGQVKDTVVPRIEDEPPFGLVKPVRLTSDELQALVNDRNRDVLWPTILAVLYNIMAPIYGQPQRGLLRVDDQTTTLSQVAVAAGCRLGDADHHVPAGEAWPTVVRPKTRWKHGAEEWFGREGGVRFLQTSALTSQIAYLNGGWFLMHSPARLVAGEESLKTVTRLIPDFLHYLASGRLKKGLWTTPLAERCASEVTGYLTERGARPDLAIRAMRRLIYRPNYAVACFGSILATLHDEKLLTVVGETSPPPRPQIFDGGRRCGTVIRTSTVGTAWIPQGALNVSLACLSQPALKAGTVTHRLRNADHFCVEETRDEKGWLIDLAWFRRQITKKYKSRAGIKLAN